MTPKEAYEARKAEREKLKDLEFNARSRTETVMLLDTLDRFVTAVERIADAMPAAIVPVGPASMPARQHGCVCPAGGFPMWLKYSDKPILNGEYWTRRQHVRDDGYRSEYEKPRGCWITDDSEDCWRSWCAGEGFNLEALTHKHEVDLDETNILSLRSAYELDAFTREYSSTCRWGTNNEWVNRYIRWEDVAARYDGIIITPYQWARRMELSWYYGWDCASGCIWNAAAIREIRLIEINMDIAKPREAEAA